MIRSRRIGATVLSVALLCTSLAVVVWAQGDSAQPAPQTQPACHGKMGLEAHGCGRGAGRCGGKQACEDCPRAGGMGRMRAKVDADLAQIEAALLVGNVDDALARTRALRAEIQGENQEADQGRMREQKQRNVKAGCVNSVCPIMGATFDPERAPENLTRMYKGRKIGFCCGGCPAQWDAMSESDKDAALKKIDVSVE